VDGFRCFFNGYNRWSSVQTLSVQPLSSHRFAHKQATGGSVPGVYMEARGTATATAGTTYLDITHNLSATPTDCNAMPTSSGWTPGFWISNIGPTTFRVNFTDPGASKTFRWTASVADA
jgi:hypothetical protein